MVQGVSIPSKGGVKNWQVASTIIFIISLIVAAWLLTNVQPVPGPDNSFKIDPSQLEMLIYPNHRSLVNFTVTSPMPQSGTLNARIDPPYLNDSCIRSECFTGLTFTVQAWQGQLYKGVNHVSVIIQSSNSTLVASGYFTIIPEWS